MVLTWVSFLVGLAKLKVPGVKSTIAKQLALFVIVYSPLQMASDAPQNYKGVKAFDFIKSVPTSWDKTFVPDAKIGEYAIFARKDRNTENWFLGAITNENPRDLSINLSFLEKGVTYKARIYADGKGADWKTNPTSVEYKEIEVNSQQFLSVSLAAGGGCAVEFVK